MIDRFSPPNASAQTSSFSATVKYFLAALVCFVTTISSCASTTNTSIAGKEASAKSSANLSFARTRCCMRATFASRDSMGWRSSVACSAAGPTPSDRTTGHGLVKYSLRESRRFVKYILTAPSLNGIDCGTLRPVFPFVGGAHLRSSMEAAICVRAKLKDVA